MNKVTLLIIFITFLLYGAVGNDLSSISKIEEGILKRNAAENNFLDGKIAERSGDSTTALKHYLTAWKLDPASDFLTTYTSEFALNSGAPAEAVYIITGGLPIKTLDDAKIRTLTSIYVTYQHYSEALNAFRELDTMSRRDSLILSDLLGENRMFREAASVLTAVDSVSDSLILFKTADLYRRAGDGSLALSLFRKLNQKYPDDRAISKGLGLSLLAFGDESEAMGILQWYLPGEKGIPDQQVMEIVGRYYASKNRYREAILLFQKLYVNDGSAKDYYYGRPLAIYSFLDGRYEYACNIMQTLLTKNPDDYELYFLLGSTYEAVGEKQNALESYNRSISLNSSFEEPYRAIVLLQVRNGNVDKALESAKLYSEKFPASPEGFALMGSILSMVKRYHDAVTPLGQAVKLYDKDIPASVLFEYSMALERSGKISEAEHGLLQLAERSPVHPAAANYLGYMWCDQNKNLAKAEKLIKSALDADPENGAYLDSYGWVMYRLKQYDRAVEFLQRSQQLINDDYVVYYHLGMVFEKMNRFKDAVSEFEKANAFDNPQKTEIASKIKELQLRISEKP